MSYEQEKELRIFKRDISSHFKQIRRKVERDESSYNRRTLSRRKGNN